MPIGSAAPKAKDARCHYCGCSEASRCDDGEGGVCDWADDEHELCTLCEDLALEAGLASLEAIVSREGLITRARVGSGPAVAPAPAAAPAASGGIHLGGDDDE